MNQPPTAQRIASMQRLQRLIELLTQVELVRDRLVQDVAGWSELPPEEDLRAVADWLLDSSPRDVGEYRQCLDYLRQLDQRLRQPKSTWVRLRRMGAAMEPSRARRAST
ncbi:MAG: hypothetical protein AMXMBFR33_36650 [Candidatus Xenobia bacterium]